MRYRQLSASGDYTVAQPFLVNSPACVGQAALTRLKLWLLEWFMDTSDGTPVLQKIVANSQNADVYIKQRILGTQGVTAIVAYSSSYDGITRKLTVTATMATQYSVGGSNQTTITTVL